MDPWIVDTDGGIDDAQALVILLKHASSFNIVGITVSFGNVELEQASKNVAEILRICGRNDVPYYNGADRPILGPTAGAQYYHGPDGLNSYWERKHGTLTPSLKGPEAIHAAQAIVRLANESSPLNILTLGPMTNLATALLLDSSLPSKLGRVVVMGGAVNARGNKTSCTEFNIYADPEAAAVSFERVAKLELLSLECIKDPLHVFDDSFFQAYIASETPIGEFVRMIVRYGEAECRKSMCDPLTACIALDPSIVLRSLDHHCTIELGGQRTRGMVVVDWEVSELKLGDGRYPSNVAVVTHLNMDKVRAIFLATVL